MRKEISPELFNYNKYPGPEFRLVGNQVLAEQLTFELVENQNDAFDATVFGQRFSEILTKFDYIVGDWSNEQLRLRGFYKEERPVTDAEKISRLEDYLLEYCSYGCAYFVLENAEPRRASFDKNLLQNNKKRATVLLSVGVVKIAEIVLKISHENVNKSKNKRLLNQRKRTISGLEKRMHRVSKTVTLSSVKSKERKEIR